MLHLWEAICLGIRDQLLAWPLSAYDGADVQIPCTGVVSSPCSVVRFVGEHSGWTTQDAILVGSKPEAEIAFLAKPATSLEAAYSGVTPFAQLRTFVRSGSLFAMKCKFRAVKLIALCSMIGLSGCGQSIPPMSRATFGEAAKRCALRLATYAYREGLLLDKPVVDFTKEPDPLKAHACSNAALQKMDREITKRGVGHIGYIWEWRA